MIKLNFEKLVEDASKLVIANEDSYISAYPVFLKYFKSLDNELIKEDNLIIASHFVYGWMPTILTLRLDQKQKVITLLNKAKSGKLLTIDELEILKYAINNSLVGLSKLLHFVNPEIYAIWDSRIYRYITKNKTSYGIGKPERYLEYLDEVKQISENIDYKKLHTLVEKHFKYKIHPTRAIEFIMFQTDRNRIK